VSDCRRFEDRVIDYLDGALSAADRVELDRHLEACGSCNETAHCYRAIREAYRAGEEDVPAPLTRTVLAAAHAGLGRSSLSKFYVVAAAVLFLALAASRFLSRPDSPTAADLVRKGDELRDAGETRRAVEAYEQGLALADTPHQRSELLYRMGSCYLELERPDSALPALEELLHQQDDVRREQGLLLFGETLERLGDPVRARSAYLRVAREFPASRAEALLRLEALSLVDGIDLETMLGLGY